MTLLLGIWALTAITSIALWSFVEIEEKKKSKRKEREEKEETLSVSDLVLLIVATLLPLVQFVLLGIGLYETIKLVDANRNVRKEEVDRFLENMNTLHECGYCGFIQRKHQIITENYTHCCGEDYRYTMVKVSNSAIYQYAPETGLTPEMGRKEAMAFMQEEQKVKKEQQEKAKKERENKDKMQNLLEKTKYIQQQNDIFLKKEHERLDKMNAEKEQRKEEVLQALQGEQREEFIQTVNLFDELRAFELKKLDEFKKTNEEKLSSLQQKLHA